MLSRLLLLDLSLESPIDLQMTSSHWECNMSFYSFFGMLSRLRLDKLQNKGKSKPLPKFKGPNIPRGQFLEVI